MASPAKPVVIFDGECNLCDGLVRFVLRHDRRRRLLLCAAQSDAGRALLAEHGRGTSPPETVYLLDGARLHERSDAALGIARHLGPPWSLLAAFRLVPRPLRDAVYRLVARNRYRWFGRRDRCRLPTPDEASRFLA